MKITFIDEIESHRAWLGTMYCPKCGEGKYSIHHQLDPLVSNCWWIECPICGHESPHMPSHQAAIDAWEWENNNGVV